MRKPTTTTTTETNKMYDSLQTMYWIGRKFNETNKKKQANKNTTEQNKTF